MPFKEISTQAVDTSQPIVDCLVVCNSLVINSLVDKPEPFEDSLDWLRDLCRSNTTSELCSSRCRLWLHDGERDSFILDDRDPAEGLFDAATSLLEDALQTRPTDEQRQNPIVFIGHGIGGLLVKQALVIAFGSASKNALFHSVYLSTYMVLFAATPHHGISGRVLQVLSLPTRLLLRQGRSELQSATTYTDGPLWHLHEQFRRLTGDIEVTYLWEQQPTIRGKWQAFIVEKDSAAPHTDRHLAEIVPVDAPHNKVFNIQDRTSRAFMIVSDSLRSCLRLAPARTRDRWQARSETATSLTARLDGHSFHANTVTGGRAHFGDNIVNIPASSSAEISRFFLSATWDSKTGGKYVGKRATNFNQKCSSDFTGRSDQLKKLHDYFRTSELVDDMPHRPRTAVIYGMGGAGKTQMCLKFAEEARQRYWGVFWIDASSRGRARDAYCALAQDQKAGGTPEAGMQWLSDCDYSWLLFLDNADDPRTNVTDLVPDSKHGHIIITTRSLTVQDQFPDPFKLKLGVMVIEEAIDFLLLAAECSHDKSEETRESAKEAATALGCLALALRLAGAAITKAFKTIADFVVAYRDTREDKILLIKETASNSVSEGSPEFSEEHHAICSWFVSYQKIGEDRSVALADATSLLSILANLHYAAVSEKMFRMVWYARTSSHPMALDFLGMKKNNWARWQARFRRAINALHGYSIIDYDSKNQVCSLHPVIHRWIGTWLRQKDDWDDSQSFTTELLASCISPYLEPSTRAFRRSLLPHIEVWWAARRKQDLLKPDPATIARVERFAALYAEVGNWKRALELQRRVVAFHEGHYGIAHTQTLSAKRIISQMQWNSFAIADAIATRVEILTLRMFSRPRWSDWRPILPPRYLEYCIALDDLTQSLWLAGELGISQHTGQIAKAWFEANLRPGAPLVLTAKLNLARTYNHLGNLQEAHKLLIETEGDLETQLGRNHPETLMAKNELGMVYLAMKEFDKAEDRVLEAYQRRQDVLGEDHAYTLWSANDLAKVYFSYETAPEVYPRAAEAVLLLKSMIPVVRRTLGNGHGGMVMTKGNLARAHVRSGEPDLAMDILGEIFEVVDQTHPNWAEVMTGQAEVQLRLGRFSDALETCERVLKQERPSHGIQIPWIFRFTGPTNPVRSSDLQREKVLRLKQRIKLAEAASTPNSPASLVPAAAEQL